MRSRPLVVLLSLQLLGLASCSEPPASDPPPDPPRELSADEPAEESTEAPPIEALWTFEGRVVDLIREEPVAEAELVFENAMLRGQGRYSATTDLGGHYRVELPSLGENGYDVRVSHPDYDRNNTWTESVLDTPRLQRYLLGTGVQFNAIQGTHRGEDGASTELDLFVYPIKLTAEERRERSEVFRRQRGGGGP